MKLTEIVETINLIMSKKKRKLKRNIKRIILLSKNLINLKTTIEGKKGINKSQIKEVKDRTKDMINIKTETTRTETIDNSITGKEIMTGRSLKLIVK